jgi:hypothetical protein
MVTKRTKGILTSRASLMLLCLYLVVSCSQLNIISKGTIPVMANDQPAHHKIVKISGKKEQFLWGMIAPDKDIVLDEVFNNMGYRSIADLSIKEWQTSADVLATFFSFGFYLPRRFEITARGIK